MHFLHQIKVLDLSRLLPGPACTWYLKEMGAQVDCVEPIGGSPTRAYPPYLSDEGEKIGVFFAVHHRGKRSICVDFRSKEGIDVIKSLIQSYDVLVEGFKPNTLEEMGLAPDVLWEINPNLIIARLSGYGQTGPMKDMPGHDLNYMSTAGALNAQVQTSKGLFIPTIQISDMAGALTAAMGICAALYARTQGKQKQLIDISLTESALSLNAHQITALTYEQKEPTVESEFLTGLFPSYRTYLCLDQRWISIAGIEPKFMLKLQSFLGDDTNKWGDVIALKTSDFWVETLKDCCVAKVLNYAELAEFPQHVQRGVVVKDQGTWIRSPLHTGDLGKVAKLGEHTQSILMENQTNNQNHKSHQK
jgi:crotonobetainyl-CoA:carnitine CoA-transferase CaiB-like acyl-CoA transferase